MVLDVIGKGGSQVGFKPEFTRLLESYHIRKVQTKNRIVKTAIFWGDMAYHAGKRYVRFVNMG